MGKRDHRDTRRRGSEYGDFTPEAPPEPSYFSRRPTPSPAMSGGGGGAAADAEVLWFNAEKGFGFVKTSDGVEAFLHARALESSGIDDGVGEGAKLRVRVEQGQKGPQVAEVLELTEAAPARPARRPMGGAGMGAGPRPPRTDRMDRNAGGPEQEGTGTVKWYNPEKGFGFIGLEGGQKDVFVHATALTRSGLTTLNEGQQVSFTYGQGAKGPEVRTIQVD
jgi:cold shock protein